MAEFPKIDLKYLKEAFKEPLNFWGLVGFGIVGVYTVASAGMLLRSSPPWPPKHFI